MSHPIFVHVMSNGDIWQSLDSSYIPSGTVLAAFRLNSNAATQKIGTISGNSGTYAVSGSTGRGGKEIV